MMQRKLWIIFGAGVATCVGALGFLAYKYQKLADAVYVRQLVIAEKKVDHQETKAGTDAQPRVAWNTVKNVAHDAVVQVIASVAQFNWLEPYKTPNQGMMAGTAFFINDKGELFTNAHVVDQATRVFIQIPSHGKERFDVDVIGVSMERDLALLRLTDKSLKKLLGYGPLHCMKLGDSDQVYRAQEIMALGFPLGQEALKSTVGVVSGREHVDGRHMIQIDAAINGGNSGGPSINMAGEVIGINTSGSARPDAENVNWIIPINEAKLFEHQLRNMKNVSTNNVLSSVKLVRKPFLGVFFNNATESMTEFLGNPKPGGAYVAEVYKGGPLPRAGVLVGDMIYEINGYRVDQYGEISVPWSEDRVSVSAYAARLNVGDNIHLVLYRKGKRKEITIKFSNTELAPIRVMFPAYEKMDYEVFAGMVLMPLSINHLLILAQANSKMVHYAEPKNQLEPAVAVTHVFPESLLVLSRTFSVGSIISEVNGITVKTLDDIREAMLKSVDTGFISIKTTDNVFAVLSLKDVLEQEDRLQHTYFYDETALTKKIKEKVGFKGEEQKTA